MPDLRHLRYFVAIVDAGSVSTLLVYCTLRSRH